MGRVSCPGTTDPGETLIETVRTIAILRGAEPAAAVSAAARCWAAGLDLVEIPVQGERGTAALRTVVREAEAEGRTVAAGTVTDERLAKIAVDAGARILVAPNLDQAVLAFAVANQVPMLPGVLTPTELAGAARLGAGAVKVFPASIVGPGHICALRPVFPEMQLVATGGVDADNARDFIAAGVSAVAFGSSIAGVITRPGLMKELHEQITAPWYPRAPGRGAAQVSGA